MLERPERSSPRAIPAAGTSLSYDAFRRLPEGAGLQLIDGLLVREPSPSEKHASLTMALAARLHQRVVARQLGRVYHAPIDVFLGSDPIQVVQPDVCFVAARRRSIIRTDGIHGAPDLVVEALSPGTRRYDAGRKRELYLANGCRELWLVDLDERWFEVVTSASHSVGQARHLTSRHELGESITSAVVPDFRVQIGKLFES